LALASGLAAEMGLELAWGSLSAGESLWALPLARPLQWVLELGRRSTFRSELALGFQMMLEWPMELALGSLLALWTVRGSL
jgi:hypothetical protein